MRIPHECGKSHNSPESLRRCSIRLTRDADQRRKTERRIYGEVPVKKSVTVTLTGEEAELAIDALAEAGHNCDRAVTGGAGSSKSGDAFRAVARKIREARA